MRTRENIRIEKVCQARRINGDLPGVYAQVKRISVVEDGEFVFAEGHELTVQRSYFHHYVVRKVIGDVTHLRLDRALRFIGGRGILAGGDTRGGGVKEDEQSLKYGTHLRHGKRRGQAFLRRASIARLRSSYRHPRGRVV